MVNGALYTFTTAAELAAFIPDNPVPGSFAYVVSTDITYEMKVAGSGDVAVAGYGGLYWNESTAPDPPTFSTGLTDTADTVTANLSTGKSGGQSAVGGTATGENLTLSSTAHATKGKLVFGSIAKGYFDEANSQFLAAGGASATHPSYGFLSNVDCGIDWDEANTRFTFVVNGAVIAALTPTQFLNYATAGNISFSVTGTETVGRDGSGNLAYHTAQGHAFYSGATLLAALAAAAFTVNTVVKANGDGTNVFEVPADATGNATAAVGRIPIKVGGVTKYLRYYND